MDHFKTMSAVEETPLVVRWNEWPTPHSPNVSLSVQLFELQIFRLLYQSMIRPADVIESFPWWHSSQKAKEGYCIMRCSFGALAGCCRNLERNSLNERAEVRELQVKNVSRRMNIIAIIMYISPEDNFVIKLF